MLEGLELTEQIKPSHSSVRTKVKRVWGMRAAREVQRFSMGFMWPLPGYGIATTCGGDRPAVGGFMRFGKEIVKLRKWMSKGGGRVVY